MLSAGIAAAEGLVPVDLKPVAVKLDLMHPVLGAGHCVHLGRKERLDIARKGNPFGVLELRRIDAGGRVDGLDVLLFGLGYRTPRHGDSIAETIKRSRR